MRIDEKDFLSYLKVKSGLDENSVKQCRIRIHILNEWLAGQELTKQLLEEFLAIQKERKLKNNSLNTYIFAFRHLKAYSIDRQLDASFFDGFKNFPKNQPQIIIFTLEEIKKILETHLTYGIFRGRDSSFLDFRYGTLTRFLAVTGCRPGEAFNLKVKNLDISAGSAQFVDTKTNKNRTNYFFEPLKSLLIELTKNRGEDDYVFINALDHRVNEQDLIKDLKRRAIQAGVTKRAFPYNFRHSYITHQLESGEPIQVVADLVGHADIQTTYRNYMHLADQTRRRAAMRHPLVRMNSDPNEIVRELKEKIENFRLREDKRFSYEILETEKGLKMDLEIK